MITWEVTLGQLILLTLSILVGFAGYVQTKGRAESNTKRLDELERELEAAKLEITKLQLDMANNFVRFQHVKEIEERLGKRMDSIEAAVRDSTNIIIKAVAGRAGVDQ